MRIALSVIFVNLVIGLVVCAIFARLSKKTIGRAVFIFDLTLIPPIIGNLLIISAPIEALSTVGCYFFFIGLNLVMGGFTYFMLEYCEIKWHKKAISLSIAGLLLIDSIQLLLNIFTGHAFSMTMISAYGADYYQFVPGVGQTIHRVLDYAVLAGCMVVFVIKIFTSPKVYREKYIVILLAMIAVTIWQTFYIVSRTPVDISMTAFGAFGVLVFLLALHYRPFRLLDRMLADITSRMPDAIVFFDTTGRCIWANKTTYILFGISNGDTDEVIPALKNKVGDYEKRGFGWNETIIKNDGSNTFSYVVERQQIIDDHNKVVGSYLIIRDNTAEQQTLQKETYNATHDSLTGALNRAGFDETLEQSDLSKVFLLFIDLDSFKQTNDEYGHNIGDQVLVEVVNVIKKHFRDQDFVCRIGGDEFAVIITNADRYTPRFVEERIQRINEELNDPTNNLPPITVSAGGAFGKDAENAYELANNADHAMYSIKFNGKNGFALFENR